jgi:hypothetical protein
MMRSGVWSLLAYILHFGGGEGNVGVQNSFERRPLRAAAHFNPLARFYVEGAINRHGLFRIWKHANDISWAWLFVP